MKKFILAALVLITSVAANAQGFGGQRREFNPEEQAKRQSTFIKETCATNDEQNTAIYNLYLEQAKKQKAQMDSIMAQMNQGGERPRFNREDMEKRQAEFNEKLKAILTADQFAAYEKAQAERRQRFGQGGPRGQRNN